MIYEGNLAALKENHDDLYKNIDNEEIDDSAFVSQARNGQKIMVFNKDNKEIYLNSKYNPESEAEKYLMEIKDMPEKSILTLFGLSNGDFVKQAIKYTNDEVLIIVYEPSKSIFMQAIKNIDLTDILTEKRVIVVVEGLNSQKYEVAMNLNLHSYNKLTNRHIALPKYTEIFVEQYNDFAYRTQELYENLGMVSNTFLGSGIKVCKNNILNMKYLSGCRSASDFVGVFPDDMPAIVVSAGPSLSKNKHLLKEAKGKALIVVVDTAIPHVMSMGVEPDMVVTADFEKPLKHFHSEGLNKIPFVVSADSNIEVLDYIKPEQVVFCAADSMLWANVFEKAGSEICMLDGGGSVATVAIATLISWGIKRLILIGQDLTFTDGSMHIGEEVSEYDFSTGHYAYVKGINGEDLITRKDYLSYLRWIENKAYIHSEIEFIDATEGGALKANTKTMTFKDAIDSYCTKEFDVKNIIDSVPRLFLNEDKKIVEEALCSMKTNLKNLKRRLSEGALECHKGSLMLSQGDYNVSQLKKIHTTIEKLNDYILQSDERVLLNKLDATSENEFEEDVYLKDEDEIKESIRLFHKCEKYYKSMVEACPKLVEIVDQCLEEMSQ